MTDEQPTQPLTDAELSAVQTRFDNAHEDMHSYSAEMLRLQDTARDVPRLLAEVDRLRAALTALGRNERAACNRSLSLQEENERIRAEATGTALGHLAKIERLQSQRDALVRKLGLDWGPDEFGDLSSVHVQSIEITNCPNEWCPGWKDSGICPNDYRHRY